VESVRTENDSALGRLVHRPSASAQADRLLRFHWVAHNVNFRRTGSKRLYHALGDLTLTCEAFDVPPMRGWGCSSPDGLRVSGGTGASARLDLDSRHRGL